MAEPIQQIFIESIFLDLENPRHEPYQSEEEVIEYLCKNEYVYALAQDIAKVGLNPLEILAVIPNFNSGKKSSKTYVVAEGNRRLCALKLLRDPELAPSEERKNFKELSKQWQAFDSLPAIIFENRDEVKDWLERIHAGLQGGIGRKQWSAEQKTRFTGDAKNVMAQQLLDHAQNEGMITAEERNNKISTVQRFITNPLFRDALGVDSSKNDELQRIRPEKDFKIVLGKFINDLKNGDVNTRFNSELIKKYSHELRTLEGLGTEVTPPQSLSSPTKNQAAPKNKPRPLDKPHYLPNNEDTEKALIELDNYKLRSIYNSLYRLNVANHCPLVTIGVWSLVESLTALNGRNIGVDFQAFLSNVKLEQLGLGNKRETQSLRESLRRLSENGNTTKHDKKAASFNDQQLINDFEILHPLIQILAKTAKLNPIAEEK